MRETIWLDKDKYDKVITKMSKQLFDLIKTIQLLHKTEIFTSKSGEKDEQ